MHRIFMALFLLSAGLLESVVSGPPLGIPSKQEQVNVLQNVQEIFERVKVLVGDEGRETDKAVISDAEQMVKRAQDTLALIEELAIIKLSCSRTENSVQLESDSKQLVQRTILEGYTALSQCTEKVSSEIHTSSSKVCEVASSATSHGQTIIDTLSDCAKKPGLQQISCYRKIMTNDVFPLKVMLVGAIDAHKAGHLRSIEIREVANECVDGIVETYQAKIANILANAIQR